MLVLRSPQVTGARARKDNMHYQTFDYDYEHRSLCSLSTSTIQSNPVKNLPTIVYYTCPHYPPKLILANSLIVVDNKMTHVFGMVERMHE